MDVFNQKKVKKPYKKSSGSQGSKLFEAFL
jgi:hypothetical protein